MNSRPLQQNPAGSDQGGLTVTDSSRNASVGGRLRGWIRRGRDNRFVRAAVLPLALLLLGGSVLTGCIEIPDLSFRSSDKVDDLWEPAAKEVERQMAGLFGSPMEPVIWEAMPARMHAARGEVELDDDDNPLVLALDLEEGYQMAPIEPGQSVVWTYGENAGAVRKVVAWDEENELLTIDEPLLIKDKKGRIDADGMVSIDPGAIMKQARPLYARHCQHCHGVTGDGAGPTAETLNPLPRDFRQGKFKFISVPNGYRPRRDDLVRILREGVNGTSMPSFRAMLTDEEMGILAEYVVWLSSRGEVEERMLRGIGSDYDRDAYEDAVEDDELADLEEDWTEFVTEDLADEIYDWGDSVAMVWERSASPRRVITPKIPRTPMSAESVARGRALFLSADSKCVGCHGRTGAGDGPQTIAFRKNLDGEYYEQRGIHDDWDHPIKPRNLHRGVYRGGRRPIDLYRRLHSGIAGAMPGFSKLGDEAIWDLVNYVLAVGSDPSINDRIVLPDEPSEDTPQPEEVAAVN